MPSSQALPAFPAERHDRMRTPGLLLGRGFFLRAMQDDDLSWLRDLYASTRAEEMAPLPWPDSAKRSFLDQQFALQHRHYMTYYGDTDFLAIEHRETGPAGRYYLQRTAPEHLIVDICLFPHLRGSGLGSLLIRESQKEAASLGRGMRLHVAGYNAEARRLYQRLGFWRDSDADTHQLMRWQQPKSVEDRLI